MQYAAVASTGGRFKPVSSLHCTMVHLDIAWYERTYIPGTITVPIAKAACIFQCFNLDTCTCQLAG